MVCLLTGISLINFGVGCVKSNENSGKFPRLCYEGKTIFVGSDDGIHWDVYVSSPGGADPKNVTKTPEIKENEAYWTRDGKVLFSTKDSYYVISENGSNKKEIDKRAYESLICYIEE